MSLSTFQDKTFLSYKGKWFVWEPSWESFRPIDAVEWTGQSFQIDDRAYCADPSDEWYGYGSSKMKQVCEALTPLYKAGAPPMETPAIGSKVEWFRDRAVMLSPCASRDKDSWKRMCRGRIHTCRNPHAIRSFTRRRRLV
jgi:hypothetical protein